MLTAADIENAARARLAELDEQAKPHESALAEINVERVALRRMLAPSSGDSIVRTWTPPAPVWVEGGVTFTTLTDAFVTLDGSRATRCADSA